MDAELTWKSAGKHSSGVHPELAAASPKQHLRMFWKQPKIIGEIY